MSSSRKDHWKVAVEEADKLINATARVKKIIVIEKLKTGNSAISNPNESEIIQLQQTVEQQQPTEIDRPKPTSPAEFAADMRHIFKNCYKYNAPESEVVIMANKLEEALELHIRSALVKF
jgi:hypothetical protein